MSKLYGESQRCLQREFDTQRLADRIEERLFRERLTSEDQDFIHRMDDGNGMYISMGNATENSHAGMLFIDFGNQKRLRVNGAAQITPAQSVDPPYPEAQFVVRVAVRQVFPNCPRYIHKLQLVERSKFGPRAAVVTPVPAWKRMEWARDALPQGDPALVPEPGAPGDKA